MEVYTEQALAILAVSLRIMPTIAFTPPFTLLRVPVLIRVLFSLLLATWLVLTLPSATYDRLATADDIYPVVFGELILGIALALSLQVAFAALLMAGRAIDIQAGFGLALLIDPTSQTQTPLIGTVFAYAAGAVFFTMGGPLEMLAIWAASIEQMPLGAVALNLNLAALLAYISVAFFLALGLAGLSLLTLFLIDLTVAFMSRTLPQMNALLLGFQIKTIALLIVLPVSIAASGAVFLRLMRLAINSAADFV